MAEPVRRSATAAVTRPAGACPACGAAALRALAYGEARIEAEAQRRAGEILAAAGLAPPPPRRHLHAVS